jgi:hypothetical protein
MLLKLKIKEAIEFHNQNRKEGTPAMTSADLALIVFKDKKSTNESKSVLFYQITNGHRRFVDLAWLDIISEVTGYPVDKLIGTT